MAGYPKNDKRGGNGPDRSDRGGFRSGGGNRGFDRGGDRDSRPRAVMHEAICASCGKKCEVPFRPTGDKPVYCRECFSGASAPSVNDRFERKERKEFTSRPPKFSNEGGTSAPSFRANPQSQNNGNNDDIKRQLEAVNSKLERLISAVQSLVPAKVSAPKETKEIVAPKVATIAKKVTKKTSTKK